MPKYAELLYNGFWYSPERLALQAAIDKTQEFVTGTVRLKLYKVMRCCRQAECTLRRYGSVHPTVQPSSAPTCCSAGILGEAQHADTVTHYTGQCHRGGPQEPLQPV